jgi:hypothetical protein
LTPDKITMNKLFFLIPILNQSAIFDLELV